MPCRAGKGGKCSIAFRGWHFSINHHVNDAHGAPEQNLVPIPLASCGNTIKNALNASE
jgi:hypothetical protein